MQILETVNSFTDLEIRSDGDGRTLCGVCVPFNQPFDAGRYVEVFRQGAFAKTIQDRGSKIPLYARHPKEGSLPLGVSTLLREDSIHLYGEFRISKTRDGDEALELVRDGALHSLSVGFIPIRDKKKSNIIERMEVKLDHVGLVPNPAYDGAKVLALRGEEYEISDTPRLAIARKRLETI